MNSLPPVFRRVLQEKSGKRVRTKKRKIRYINREIFLRKCEDMQEGLRKLYKGDIPNNAYIKTKHMNKYHPIVMGILHKLDVITKTARYTYIVDYPKLMKLIDIVKNLNMKKIPIKMLREEMEND